MAKTRVLPVDEPNLLHAVIEKLRQGGLVAFPTDTVYGLGADAWNATAVDRIYSVKDRSELKAIPVLLGAAEDLLRVAHEPLPIVWQLAAQFWPGPLTIVVERRPDLPLAVSAGDTVGVRVPDHPFALELLAEAGPLAVTSANRSGEDSARTAQAVLEGLGERIDLLVDGGEAPGGVPSTVIDCTVEPPRLLRQGPLHLEALLSSAGVG